MIIAIDLDGTICNPISKSDKKSEVMGCTVYQGAREFLKKAKKRGHYIKIFTHRTFSLITDTKRWLKINDILYDELIADKPKYHLFIDDRVIKYHGNWKRLNKRFSQLEKKYEDKKR